MGPSRWPLSQPTPRGTGSATPECLLTGTQQAGQGRAGSKHHTTGAHTDPARAFLPLTFLQTPGLGDFPVLQQSLGVLDL